MGADIIHKTIFFWICCIALISAVPSKAVLCLDAFETIALESLQLATGEFTVLPFRPRSAFAKKLSPEAKAQYERYLADTFRGHQAMRGQNGLIMDTVFLAQDGNGGFQTVPYKTGAAPTDIGLDLILQVGMAKRPETKEQATQNIERVMETLEQLPEHQATGLFYRLYETRPSPWKPVIDADVSSVDNIHLALGLWTVAQNFPGTPIAARAEKRLSRMNFSAFYDPQLKLLGGNLKNETSETGEAWRLEPYRYHFGTEARSVYTLGHAMGLFRDHVDGNALQAALAEIPIELRRRGTHDHVLVWNGGVFQALLPRALANEELYSKLMKESAGNVGKYMLSQGPYLPAAEGRGFRLPAGHSASVTGVDTSPDLFVTYNGELGGRPFKVTANPNTMDDSIVTMHAVLLGASVNPVAFAPRLAKLETLERNGSRLYLKGFGWVDSTTLITVEGKKRETQPNSAGVGVDKGIELLSLLQILDKDGMSVSGKALADNPVASGRLREAFGIIDQRWSASRPKIPR